MKKIYAVILSVLMLIPLSACSSDEPVKKNGTLLNYYETSEEYFDYINPSYSFRLPVYWKGKFAVEVYNDHEDFYEKTSYEENGTGLVFSIYSYDDKSYKKEHKKYEYLLYDETNQKHYILAYPKNEEYKEDSKKVYEDLKMAIQIIQYTFSN